MNEIEKSRIDRIIGLHTEIDSYLKITLDRAIEIGGLLEDQKADLGHGQWLPWVKENLPFSERTARDYMSYYARRDELKSAKIADLPEARKYLSPPKVDADNESQLGPEWFDAELVELHKQNLLASKDNPPEPGTVSVPVSQLKMPDTERARLQANQEIINYRDEKFKFVDENFSA